MRKGLIKTYSVIHGVGKFSWLTMTPNCFPLKLMSLTNSTITTVYLTLRTQNRIHMRSTDYSSTSVKLRDYTSVVNATVTE